jgi:hypothetical protein
VYRDLRARRHDAGVTGDVYSLADAGDDKLPD